MKKLRFVQLFFIVLIGAMWILLYTGGYMARFDNAQWLALWWITGMGACAVGIIEYAIRPLK